MSGGAGHRRAFEPGDELRNARPYAIKKNDSGVHSGKPYAPNHSQMDY